MTKNEIISKLNKNVSDFTDTCRQMEDAVFFSRREEKWSPAENTNHLMLAATPLIFAFIMPRFILGLLFGKPNRPPRSYEATLDKYNNKLLEGGKASAPYVPKTINSKTDVAGLINDFNKIYKRLVLKFDKWKDMDLDNYLLPHPLLGKLTLREMMYFTTFHIEHHHKAVKKYMKVETV
ncbi:MAG: DinB family protein [Chitinophagales bacterium]